MSLASRIRHYQFLLVALAMTVLGGCGEGYRIDPACLNVTGITDDSNSRHVSGTVQHSQYECAVLERLEDDQVISVRANPYRVAQVRTRRVMMRSLGSLLAVLPYLANERVSAPRIVERDLVADVLQVNFGLWCEVRAHSLRAFFGHFGVFAF